MLNIFILYLFLLKVFVTLGMTFRLMYLNGSVFCACSTLTLKHMVDFERLQLGLGNKKTLLGLKKGHVWVKITTFVITCNPQDSCLLGVTNFHFFSVALSTFFFFTTLHTNIKLMHFKWKCLLAGTTLTLQLKADLLT